jgi:hypothetical protein
VLRTGGFFSAGAILLVIRIPMDDGTHASTSDHQFGRIEYPYRWAGKEHHDVDQE